MSKRKPPGEWLASLLPPRQFPATPLLPGGGLVTPCDSVLEIPLDRLDANPYQSRTSVDEKSLQELAESIQAIGLMEPIVVRANGGGRYQVIAGERRVKACYMAGVYKVPAVVRQVSDQQAAAMTVIENLLREDVNPMDQAHAFYRLVDEFDLRPDEIAAHTGKSRPAVVNFLRLLQLPPRVQDMVRSGKLSMGHGKALLVLCDEGPSVVLDFAQQATTLSVRETENLVRKAMKGEGGQLAKRLELSIISEIFKTQSVHVQLHQKASGSARIVVDVADAKARDAVVEAIKKAVE